MYSLLRYLNAFGKIFLKPWTNCRGSVVKSRMPVTEVKFEECQNTETRLMVAPVDMVTTEQAGPSARVVRLRHPKTGAAACYLYSAGSARLLELLSFDEEHRSWFVGSKVRHVNIDRF